MPFTVKDILQLEVTPALGCTEPVAIALGAAAAASLLPGESIDHIEVWVDPNIYKNGMAVIIPSTGGMTGLDTASAVGAFGGDPCRGLEVLDTLDEPALLKAKALLKEKKVVVHLLEKTGLHIRTIITSGQDRAESEVKELHNNIVALSLNGHPVTDSPLISISARQQGKSAIALLEEWLMSLTLDDIYELLDDIDDDDLAYLKKGVDYNVRLAEHGLKYGSGLGIGKAIDRQLKQKLLTR
ncbi:MAG: serine dehydratase subunit alpha family protein, partial [Desulfocapsaceae bacterium]|nr:serine dehydratase subunit alpha family protein [Desulfocapsaceae bacterium]